MAEGLRWVWGGLLLASAGCDGGSERAPVKKIVVGESGGYLERLRALSQQDRDLTLRRAILDSGQRCRRIRSSTESGSYENMAIFAVRCDERTDWAVFVTPGGDVQVRSCVHVERLGLPECRIGDDPRSPASSVKG